MFKKFLSSDSSTSKDIKMMYYYLSKCENSTYYYILYRFLKISLNFCVSFPLILTWNLLKGVEFYCVRNFQNLKKYTKILVKKANIRSKILWKLIEKNVLKNNYIPKIKIYSPLIMNFFKKTQKNSSARFKLYNSFLVNNDVKAVRIFYKSFFSAVFYYIRNIYI